MAMGCTARHTAGSESALAWWRAREPAARRVRAGRMSRPMRSPAAWAIPRHDQRAENLAEGSGGGDLA